MNILDLLKNWCNIVKFDSSFHLSVFEFDIQKIIIAFLKISITMSLIKLFEPVLVEKSQLILNLEKSWFIFGSRAYKRLQTNRCISGSNTNLNWNIKSKQIQKVAKIKAKRACVSRSWCIRKKKPEMLHHWWKRDGKYTHNYRSRRVKNVKAAHF